MTDLLVWVNGSPWELREDLTCHLGMTAYYRLEGKKTWRETDIYGRATLSPGESYEVVWSSMPLVSLNWMERLRTFIINLL